MDLDTPWHEHRLVVADIEGNGYHPPDLVELAVVPIVDGIIGEPASWLVRPTHLIAWQATRVHGITNNDVTDLPGVNTVADDIRIHLDDAVLVAHNAHVDLDVLTRELAGWQPDAVIDTLRLARTVLPGHSSFKLGALVDLFNLDHHLPPGLTPHRATYDALVTARLLVHLAEGPDGPLPLRDLVMPATTSATDPLF